MVSPGPCYWPDCDATCYVARDGRLFIVKAPEDRQPVWSEPEVFSEDAVRGDQSHYKRFEDS